MALVVFLRGVNVGGHRSFRPSVLAGKLRHLDAVNIGAAGTFVIRARVKQSQVRAELRRRLPFETHIMIFDSREIGRLLSLDVFERQSRGPGVTRFVSVLERPPRSRPTLPITMPSSGRWLLKVLAREGRFVLGVYRRHMKVIGYLGTLDRTFGAPMTTRNWTTIRAIAAALDAPRRGTRA